MHVEAHRWSEVHSTDVMLALDSEHFKTIQRYYPWEIQLDLGRAKKYK